MTGRRRLSVLAFTAVLLAGVGLLVAATLQDTLTYYRTPSEVAAGGPATDERIRVGGQVVPGSVRRSGGRVQFRLTDGSQEITVVQRGGVPGTFREGEGAVVEGLLGGDGVFRADTVVVRHDNEYGITPAAGNAG